MIKCKYCKRVGEPVEVTQPWGKGRRTAFYCPNCGEEMFARIRKNVKIVISEKQFRA